MENYFDFNLCFENVFKNALVSESIMKQMKKIFSEISLCMNTSYQYCDTIIDLSKFPLTLIL